MLEVELDILSGMPNPTWILSGEHERELVDRIAADPAQLSPAATAEEQFSLGYRGLLVRTVKTDGEQRSLTLPQEFRVGSRPATEPAAEWLLGTAESYRDSGVTDVLREAAAEGIARIDNLVVDPAQPATGFGGREQQDNEDPDTPNGGGEGVSTRGATWWACGSNYFSANADLFNRPENVTRNNCYCFASNHLAGVRYALPGKRGGRPATSITCGGCTDGLRADGWQDGCQTNGLTIAMVIWPNVDYHFYRLVTGGPNWWWGHKPGGTPAKYTDDCGHAIYQENGTGYAPNNICRGNYTNFCGYFYQNNSTALVA
ncbi:hypothetical protein ACFFQW_18970 [Umezawaea endophytica]|uniref:Uncharacterized protein n=1 Tax=Umezawaea endophytica TaxID=1654476 RepID=A0A9X3AGN2_9PSEU|nr:hypothetical protein [Umezawaea endophytica]MCS7479851.1 hypothetical protein [Umezawaea endophytica]